MRLAEAELDAAQARAAAAPDDGIRLFGSASLAHGRDATRPERYRIDNVLPEGAGSSREQVLTALPASRQRVVGQVGIRLPLFGSRAAVHEAGKQAGSAASAQRHRHKTAELEVLKALRYAYAEAYYANMDLARARDYAARGADSRRSLDARRARRLMLADEHSRLLSTFAEAGDDMAEAAAVASSAVTTIKLITGLDVDAAALDAPVFPVQCLSAGRLRAALDAHPDIAYHRAVATERRRALPASGTDGVEGGLSLSQSALRETGGRSGYSSAIAIDISIPLELKRLRSARRALAAAELRQAELALEGRRNDYLGGVENALRTAGIARQRLATLLQREAAEAEGVRIAEVRLARARQEGPETLIQKHYAYYAAARAAGRTRLALAQREADLLGFGQDCGATAASAPGAAGAASAARALRPASGPGPDDGHGAAGSTKPGWYAWYLYDRIAAAAPESVLAGLPPARRILLSLTRADIERISSPGPGRQRLRAFIDAAGAAGIGVELLLGDPSWALQERHADLLALLERIGDLPFTGLHLDIERSQLPTAQQSRWEAGIAALTRQVSGASRLPLALSLHPRDASDSLLRILAANGVDEVTVMYYSTRVPGVAAFMARVMQAHPRLGISLAQSVERELPDAESYGRMRPDRALTAMREVGKALEGEPNFRGVLVQSLDQFLESQP
ncbi:hypothetical protein JN27_02230 [Massilia sp. BSC265]|nr:hypothetical protein JN27_02230 [Massilia sp. BSC265]